MAQRNELPLCGRMYVYIHAIGFFLLLLLLLMLGAALFRSGNNRQSSNEYSSKWAPITLYRRASEESLQHKTTTP